MSKTLKAKKSKRRRPHWTTSMTIEELVQIGLFGFRSLRRPVNANVQNNQGDTALHLASLNNHHDAVKTLLKYDASTNLMDETGCFPLHLAAWSGNADICATLLKQGPSLAKVNEQNYTGDTALHTACQHGHTETVRILLQNFADPLIRNRASQTALDLASQYGRLECVRLLLNSCPALVHSTTVCHSPLSLAARGGHKDVVLSLLLAGIDVNSVSESGSALHEAAQCEKTDIVALLLQHGVDLSLQDSGGRTALELVQTTSSDSAQEIARIIALKSDTKFASYPRPNPTYLTSETCNPNETNSLKISKSTTKHRHNLHSTNDLETSQLAEEYIRSHSPQYATSLNSSQFSSLTEEPLFQSLSAKELREKNRESVEKQRESRADSIEKENERIENSIIERKEEKRESSPSLSPAVEYVNIIPAENGSRVPVVQVAVQPNLQRTSKNLEYAVVKCTATKGHTLPRTDQVVYNEDLYEVVDADWFDSSRDPMSAASNWLKSDDDVTTPDKPEVNGKSLIKHVPDLPALPKLANIRNNNTEYLNMDSSNFKESPRMRVRSNSSDGEYVEVSPIRETAIVNGQSDADVDDTIETAPKGPISPERPPSLILARMPPNGIPGNLANDITTVQLPTPDHPPPSPKTALRGIQQFIHSKDKRRSKDMETSTDDPNFGAGIQSKKKEVTSPRRDVIPEVTLSRRLSSTPESSGETSSGSEDDVDGGAPVVEVRTSTQEPFKATGAEEELDDGSSLIKGSAPGGKRRAMSAMYEDMVVRAPVKRSSLNINVHNQPEEFNTMFKEIDDVVIDLKSHKDTSNEYRRSVSSPEERTSSQVAPQSIQNGGGSVDKLRDDSHSEDWAEIADIMASFGGRITRESVFIRDFEEEFTRLITGSNRAQSIGDWLSGLSLSQYENILVPNGFDDMDFMASNVMEECDLIEMCIYNQSHRDLILNSLKQMPNMKTIEDESPGPCTVEVWLQNLHLEVYIPVFLDHDYKTMERVREMWELELTTVLDITTLGHRKRILGSLGLAKPRERLDNMEKMDLSQLSWTMASEDSGVATDLHPSTSDSHDATSCSDLRDTTSSDVIGSTSDMATTSSDVGTTSSSASAASTSSRDVTSQSHRKLHKSLTTPAKCSFTHNSESGQFRSRKSSSDRSDVSEEESERVVRRRPRSQHHPASKRISYSELELRPPQDTMHEGNHQVQHWRHKPEELIKGCCYYFAQYLGSTYIRELSEESTHESIVKLKHRHWERLKNTSSDTSPRLPLITLAISYHGVKFIEARTRKVICEHEIGNIFCVRQDDEHRNFFAYITEDLTNGKHYCHVFSVKTTDLAAEITLTLGESFEVAYQMAMREKALATNREYEDLLDKTESQLEFALSNH